MQLNARPTELLLFSLAEEVMGLLSAGEIDKLADRFGYAVKYNRDAATAIREDLAFCLSDLGASSHSLTKSRLAPTVRYFKPNDTNLVAAVECVANADNGAELQISLIVTGSANTYFITLEGLYAPPAE